MSNIVDQGHVNFEVNSGIATIEFGHPLSNSLPGKILRKLASVISEQGNNDAVNVIVLKSSGDRAFCAGASFDELLLIDNKQTGNIFFQGFAEVINACRKCPKFIIGRVQGKAVGGGVGLASAVDYCLATKHASIKLSELAVGIGPFVVGPVVERKIGLSAMSSLTINATEWRSAQWALSNGLYSDIYEDELNLLRKEINVIISKQVGAIAKLDKIQFVPGLPKTRSGKIMRRILRKIAEGDVSNLGDISTLLNPEVVTEIQEGKI